MTTEILIGLAIGIFIGYLITINIHWSKWELVEANVRVEATSFNVITGCHSYKTIANRYTKRNSITGKVKYKTVPIY